MEKYLVGINEEIKIEGYTHTKLDVAADDMNTTIVLNLDSMKEDLRYYYSNVKKAINNRSRVIVISKDKSDNIFKAVSSLLIKYDKYDIYECHGEISAEYIEKLVSRKPKFNEVQMFMNSNIKVPEKLSEVLSEMIDKSEEDDIRGLCEVVEKNRAIINESLSMIEEVNALNDKIDTNEINKTIEEYKTKVEELIENVRVLSDEKKELEERKVELEEKSERLSSEYAKVKRSLAEIQKVTLSGDSYGTVSLYTTCNLNSYNCDIKHVLYVKEISRVPFINTFMSQLYNIITLSGCRAKMMIYDNNNNLSVLYNNSDDIRVYDAKQFADYFDDVKKNIGKMVICEPNNAVIQQMVETKGICDVLIIYDKLGYEKDILEGNNVTKLFVVNSYNDYITSKGVMNIDSLENVITSNDCTRLGEEAIRIPRIQGFDPTRESKAATEYSRLSCRKDGTSLVEEICGKMHLDIFD